MILPFSTQLNGKPTYFVEKIQTALKLPYFKDSVGLHEGFVSPNFNFYVKSKCIPKLHTIRLDEKDRWKTGTMIDFFINCRQKDMFRFAPRIPVVSTQEIVIKWIGFNNGFRPYVWIDRKLIFDVAGTNKKEILQLAQNDGFDTIEAFFAYFNEDFKGKLIHWTDLKY